MQMLKYIPLQLLACLMAGIIIGFYADVSLEVVYIVLASSLIFLVISFVSCRKRIRISPIFSVSTFVVFFSIGMATITFHNDLNKRHHYVNSLPQEGAVQAVLKITSILKPNNYYRKYEAQVLKINGENTQGKILVNVKKDSLEKQFRIDDKLLIGSAFLEIEDPKNPYQFHYKNYLKKRHVYRQVIITNEEFIQLKNSKLTLKGYADKFRVQANETLTKNGFDGDELAIVNALLLGQRQEISKGLIQDYSKAGAIHILAVSGLHVGIIMLMLSFLAKPLKRIKNGNSIQLIIIVSLLWVFAFIAGMSASVVRAVAMFTAISIGLAIQRKNSVYKNLIISMFFLLLFNPYYVFEVGFQLSYLAVFFIVWLQPIIYRLWKPKWKFLDYFWQLFTVSLAAQIGVLPLSLYYFHQFPGLFFVANLVIVPILGFVLGLGIVIIFLGWVNLAPTLLLSFYKGIITTMNSVISWIAAQKAFVFQEISFSLFLVFTSYLMVVFTFRWIQHKTMHNFKYALLTIIFLQGTVLYQKYELRSIKEFTVFNKSRVSVVATKERNTLVVATTATLEKSSSILSDYKTGRDINTIIKADNFSNFFKINNKNILVIDSLSTYTSLSFKIDKVLLTDSPKINLERLIETIKPTLIIADASNYKSYVRHWQTTCSERNIAFHYTAKDGAYVEKW